MNCGGRFVLQCPAIRECVPFALLRLQSDSPTPLGKFEALRVIAVHATREVLASVVVAYRPLANGLLVFRDSL